MRRGVRARFVIVAFVALALAGAACASKSASGAGGGASSPPPTSGGGGYGGYGGYGGGSGSGGSASGTLTQGAGGYVFTPASLTVKKGQSITVKDVGTVAHTFTIDGKGIDVVNNPGQSQSVKIDLAPGTYTFICRFHVNQGMHGTLTVQG